MRIIIPYEHTHTVCEDPTHMRGRDAFKTNKVGSAAEVWLVGQWLQVTLKL
jgi:hypothetical protein